MAPVTANRIYEDYDPPSDLVTEEECDTILIYLPGYRKDQLKVQLTTSRIIKISGERQVGDNKWKRFHKQFRVPNNCDTKEITAKFEGGILYIRQPKLITPASAAPDQPADKAKTAAEAPKTPQQQQQPPPIPQQEAPALSQPRPRPQPQPQPQPEAPLAEPQKAFEEEEKTSRDDSEEDEFKKEKKGEITQKDEEGKDQCELKERPPQVVGRRGIFRELRRPENFKRLILSVLLVFSIGFYVTYMFKSFMGDDKESVLKL